jgi:hypothetical protein
MDTRKEIQKLVLAVTLWVAMARKEEVLVVRPAKPLAKNTVLSIQMGVRPSGYRGLHVLDEWCYQNKDVLLRLFRDAKGLPQDAKVGGHHHISIMGDVLPLELATNSKLSDEEREAQALALGLIASKVNPKNPLAEGHKESEVWLPVAAPQSNTSLRLFWRGVSTPLKRVVEGLTTNTMDLVMYFLSLMNAKVAGFMPDSPTGLVSGKDKFKVVIADLSKPLEVDQDTGLDIYSNTCGGDGNTPFTWTDFKSDLQGQIRGFALNLLKSWGLIAKGVGVGDNIWLAPDCSSLTKTYTAGVHKVIVLDLNIPKGKGKLTPEYLAVLKEAKAGVGRYAKPVMVDEDFYLWFIRTVKAPEEHRGELSISFQETAFERCSWTRVDAEQLTNNLIDRICRVSPEKEGYLDECLGLVDVDLAELALPNGEIPRAAMLESVNSTLSRAASSACFRKGQLLKAWGNQLVPCGWVVMSPEHLEYPEWDENRRMKVHDTSQTLPFFKSPYWEAGWSEFGRMVAHRRTPQLTPWCLSTARAITLPDLKQLAYAIMVKEEEWITQEGLTLRVEETVWAMLAHHNARVQDKGYKGKWGELHLGDEGYSEFSDRLVMLLLSLESSRIDSFFVTQPLDGRDRQEDHDGDDTMACPSRFWVEKYRQTEAYWRRLPLVVLEPPKSSKMNLRDPRLSAELPQPDGSLRSEVNPKGATLSELFPSVEWATPERIAAIVKTTLADPQGPTGMASNVAADVFSRVAFVDHPNDKTWRGEAVLMPHPASVKAFKVWVFNALIVQISLDFPKSPAELPRLKHWESVVDRLLAAGGDGVKGFIRSDRGEDLEMADLSHDCPHNDLPELAENWCYNPAIIYSFAESLLEVKVCLWKGIKGRFRWKATSGEIVEAVKDLPESRFKSVNLAMHLKEGVVEGFGRASDYVEEVADKVRRKTNPNIDLLKAFKQAFFYVEGETLKAGEDGDLERLSANYRGNLFLRGLGFDREATEKLLAGETATSSVTQKLHSYADILVAAAHAADDREVDAFEIAVSFYVSQREISDEAKKLTALGEEIRDDFLRGVAEMTSPSPIKPIRKGEALLVERSLYKDLGELWEQVLDDSLEYSEAKIEEICVMADSVGEDFHESLSLAKMAMSRVLSVVHAARTYLLRGDDRYRFERAVESFRHPIGLPKGLYQLELRENPNAKHRLVCNSDSGDKYVRQRKDKPGEGAWLGNWCDSHWWLPAVGHDCPTRMATQALTSGRPFVAQPDAARALHITEQIFAKDGEVVIKCRTLTGSGGYITSPLVNEAIKIVKGDKETYGSIFGALAMLRGAASSRILSDRESEWETSSDYHARMVDGELSCLPLPQGVQNFLEDNFGLTPLPGNFGYEWVEEGELKKLRGGEALQRFLKNLLTFLCVEEHITLTDMTLDARIHEYEDAKRMWVNTIHKYDLPLDVDAAKGLYWFTAMAVSEESPLRAKKSRYARLKATAVNYEELGL